MLDNIPAKHQRLNLATLRPLLSKDDPLQMQAKTIKAMREQPYRSYLLYGPSGVGKTGLCYALLRHLIEQGRTVYHFTLSDLLRSFQPASPGIAAVQYLLPIEDIPTRSKITVLLDDVDKAIDRPTPFRAETLGALTDALYRNEHQVLMTTQVPPDELDDILERGFDRHGVAIARRLKQAHEATTVNFFPPKKGNQ